ncbi:MAG: hypothetical protein ACYTG0_41115 [Planctomycetota bacterium]
MATRAVDALDHAFRTETEGVDLDRDVHRASQALERLVSIVAKAPRLRHDSAPADRFREEKVLQRLAASFRVPEEEIRRRLTALRRSARRSTTVSPDVGAPDPSAKASPTIDPWQRELLEILIRHPKCLATVRAEIDSDRWPDGPGRRVYQACCRLSDAGEQPTFERLMLEFDDPATKSLLVKLDEVGLAKEIADPERLLESLLQRYREQEAARKWTVQQESLRKGGLVETEQRELLRKIEEQARARHGISDPTDG